MVPSAVRIPVVVCVVQPDAGVTVDGE